MKIIFAGTPQFAVSALAALTKEHQIIAVLTQPDRPSGRGMQLTASPVKQFALQQGLQVLQPASLKSDEAQQAIAQLDADLMVVAAYGLILPKAVLQMPRRGCLNIHASLLPRWRGAAPIQRAILAGDAETGITIMQMDEGLDTGDMLLKKTCAIAADDTAQTLHDKLAELGAQAIVEALQNMQQGKLVPEKQDARNATYAAKLTKGEAQLDWKQDAEQLDRAVRGYFPFPTANTLFGETPIKILRASLAEGKHAEPGQVIATDNGSILVACGNGALALEVLQKPGGKAVACCAICTKPAYQSRRPFHHRLTMQRIQLEAAKTVHKVVHEGRNLTQVLSEALRRHSGFTAQERGALQDLCYGTLRYHSRLACILDESAGTTAAGLFLAEPAAGCALSVAIHQGKPACHRRPGRARGEKRLPFCRRIGQCNTEKFFAQATGAAGDSRPERRKSLRLSAMVDR